MSLRRLAAVLEVVGHAVPEPLAAAATAQPGESPLFLGDRCTHGARARRLPRWQVVVTEAGPHRQERRARPRPHCCSRRNGAGAFELQISYRLGPILDPVDLPLVDQPYFRRSSSLRLGFTVSIPTR